MTRNLRALRNVWKAVIGIETHAQLNSHHKLFSESPIATTNAAWNSTYNAFDAAFPGTLPHLNANCVTLALKAAISLNCDIEKCSSFDRKHYFYADIPLGYQITQHYKPFARNGYLSLPNRAHPIRIKQIQIEQDTAKSMSDRVRDLTHVDLNRAGTGLLEIVTEPDITSAEEAAMYVRELQSVLRRTGVSEANMESGSLRCDVNVSINKPGQAHGTRCEIKNLNSVRFIVGAINYELSRQSAILDTVGETSKSVKQETRAFDPRTWKTYSLRTKEDTLDYRYMPDPNLGYLHVSSEQIQEVKASLPHLPAVIRQNFTEKYIPLGVSQHDVAALLDLEGDVGGSEGYLAYFEEVCDIVQNPSTTIKWIINDLRGVLTKLNLPFSSRPDSRHMAELVSLVEKGSLTRPSAKLLLQRIVQEPLFSTTTLAELADEMSLISAPVPADHTLRQIQALCSEAIKSHPSEVRAIQSGSRQVLNKLIGWVMQRSSGRVDAKIIRETLAGMIT